MAMREALVALRPGAAAYVRSLADLPGSLVGAEARVAALALYPVKGLAALRLPRARVGRRGLFDPDTGLADRGVMLAYRRAGTTADGAPFDAVGLANRNEPALALTRARLAGGVLVYEAPGLAPLRLAPASLAPSATGERLRVRLPYDGAPVIEAALDDGPLAAWARELLRARPAPRRFTIEDVVALRASSDHRRAVDEPDRAGEDAETLFGDGAHALVASSATLAWMNRALAAEGAREIAMEAFRPNVVLDGLPPNAEDLVAEARVLSADGPARLVFGRMCVRCDATRVDYATGARPDAQPLAWLARNRPPRPGSGNSATFAINAVFPREAEGRVLAVGDAVRVVEER